MPPTVMLAVASRAARGVRADDRALLASAGVVFACASAGAAMSAAAADALFLAELGPAHLGTAVAVSSGLLAIVLGVVGGLADRLERRRVLASLAMVSALVIAGLAALSIATPAVAAVILLVVGKQLAAATDLAFWVVIAERLDARRSQRLLPVIAATGGAGAALGAGLVIPLAAFAGTRAVMVCAAAFLVLAGLGAARLTATRRVGGTGASIGQLVVRSWRDGARAVQRSPLAMNLAVVVGIAGVFGSLAYFALGVELAAQGDSAARLATLLGVIRGVGQLATLVVQLVVAPRLLARLGTGPALFVAPLVALAAAIGLVAAPILVVAIAMQMSSRILDAGVETPAEKLAQTLLPTSLRGRIAGFLDGPAKRLGAMAGGFLASALAHAPTAFYGVTAGVAGIWLVAARKISRDLPALAIEHVSQEAQDLDAALDDRAVEQLGRELAGARPQRAAEVLVRLHERRRIDAAPLLSRAVRERGGVHLWRALVAVLDRPTGEGPSLLAAASTATGEALALGVRAAGLAGGADPAAFAAYRDHADVAIALAAEAGALRAAGDRTELLAVLGDAIRDSGPIARAAIEELCAEVAAGLVAEDTDRTLGAARHLARALRRGRGDVATRVAAYAALARVVDDVRETRSAELSLLRADLLELARERVEQGASAVAPPEALTSLLRRGDAHVDDAPETAAAVRLYGALLEGDVIEPEDLRRLAHALGEPDDEVRDAAETALAALGAAGAGELVATAAWGRRRARDRAAALLHDLPVTPAALDRLVDAELDALDQTAAAVSVMTEPGDELLARRLDERLREIAHTVLLLVAARHRSRPIQSAAIAWRHARDAHERARTLAVIEAALPRPLVGRLVEAVDDLTPSDRAAALVAKGVALPSRDAVIRAELASRDRLSRALVLHAIGAAGRSAHRDAIAQAATAEVAHLEPADLLRRLTHAFEEEEGPSEMPSRVETLMALGRVPLLAPLSTRQLADVAERARWSQLRAGAVVVTAGDSIDALIVVDDGELALGDRTIAKGDVVDELAPFAPQPASADLRATRPTRLIRLERIDLEELVDDVPGLAAAVCRALAERARRST